MTEDKKYQIFISSTFLDLEEERDKIIETILGIYHLPVGMEMFSAGNDEQWEIIKDTIASSDYYILIIAHRYGSVTKEGISYTEKEYNYAVELDKPILAFIKNQDTPTEPKQRESDPEKIKKLNEFITKVTANKMCDFWSTKDELAVKVAIALPKTFRRNPQIGWIRGDQAISPKFSEELVALSSKNRELLDELNELKKKISTRSPELKVYINDQDNLYHYAVNKEGSDYIKICSNFKHEDIPRDLQKYISKEEIDVYNSKLPDRDTLDKYERDLYFYTSAVKKSNNSKLEIRVANTGTIKANNVFVTLSFPSELLVYDLKEENELEKPNINLPVHPLHIAKERKEQKEKYNNLRVYGPSVSGIDINALSSIKMPKIQDIISPNINYWTSLRDNTVTVKLSELLHTRSRTFKDSYVILPRKAGQFEIKISIISEELEQMIEYDIPAIVDKI